MGAGSGSTETDGQSGRHTQGSEVKEESPVKENV